MTDILLSSRLTYEVLVRTFSSTAIVAQRPDHPLYPLVDWALVKAGSRAIVDPFDPSAILYISSKEYQRLVLVAISNETTIVVLATPSDKPTATSPSAASSPSNPPKVSGKKLSEKERVARVATLLQDHLVPEDLRGTNFLHWGRSGLSWKSWFARYTTPVQSGSVRKLLLLNERNLVVILRRWGYTLSTMTGTTFGIGLRADLLAFTVHCHKVLETQGLLALTVRMRTYLFCVNQYLSGHPMKSTSSLGSGKELRIRLIHGLPAALPLGARLAFRNREPNGMRIWSSMLNAYRAFAVNPSELTMGRIESTPFVFPENALTNFTNFLHRFWAGWSALNPMLVKPDLTIKTFPFLSTAGPNGSPSILQASTDAYAWFISGRLPNLFRAWKVFGVTEEVSEAFFASLSLSHATYLGKQGPGLPYVLQRIFTGAVLEDPKRQWEVLRKNFPSAEHRGEKVPFWFEAFQLAPSKFMAPVGGAVRKYLQSFFAGGVDRPGYRVNKKGKWVEASSNTMVRSWLARFLYNSLDSFGNMTFESYRHIAAVLETQPNPDNLPVLGAEPKDPLPKTSFLGRLSFKYGEPAGKTRWFAIVDYFTQQALLPLHDYLFKCLRSFPGDATFDQEAAVRRLATLGPNFWCYDLTAATDVIPVQVYQRILNVFCDSRVADAWRDLLVDRDFVLKAGSVPNSLWPESCTDPKQVIWSGRYTRGQPMGALSSWGALAIAHHLVIQYAAYRVGAVGVGKVFELYAVLGDDVVIAHEQVASEYLKVCNELGIEINLLKSFVSTNGFFQFAQRNWVGQIDVSPLSLREEVNVQTVQDRAAMVRRALDRGYFTLSDAGSKCNLIRQLVKRFVTPNQAAFLSTRFWADKAGLGVDIASKIVAPLLLQPKGPLSGLLRPAEGVVWEWLQSLTRAFSGRNSLFYRGTVISDSQAQWYHQDLVALYSAIILPLRDHLAKRVDTVKTRYLDTQRKIFLLRHECPMLSVAWITRIWQDFVPIYTQGEGFLRRITTETFPGSPASGLPIPVANNPLPPQGVAAALSSLSQILDYLERFNPPFDLLDGDPLKPSRSIDHFTERIRRIWVNVSPTHQSAKRGPPRSQSTRRRKK